MNKLKELLNFYITSINSLYIILVWSCLVFVWFMFVVIFAYIYCCYLSLKKKKLKLRIMFGGSINFGVMLRPQHFYNKSYVKSCY